MGYSEDIMHNFALRELKAVFPASEGWQKRGVTPVTLNSMMYEFSRRNKGMTENAVAAVSFEPRITPAMIIDLFKPGASILNCTKRILLVPMSASLPAVPAEITVLAMNSFGIEEGRLAWLTKRRPLTRSSPETPVEA